MAAKALNWLFPTMGVRPIDATLLSTIPEEGSSSLRLSAPNGLALPPEYTHTLVFISVSCHIVLKLRSQGCAGGPALISRQSDRASWRRDSRRTFSAPFRASPYCVSFRSWLSFYAVLFCPLSLPTSLIQSGQAIDFIQAHVSEITFPFLLLHSPEDRLTAIEGSKFLYEKAPSSDKTFIQYEVQKIRYSTLLLRVQ